MADSESLESSESFTSSDSISNLSATGLDEAVADNTSNQSGVATEEAVAKKKLSDGLFEDFNIFNAMLMAALLFIMLACLFMFMEVSDYGGLFSSPWRTGSVGR